MSQVENCLTFIQTHPTAFHVASGMADALAAHGYERLLESGAWELKAGGKYVVTRNDSAVIAFAVPVEPWQGFTIAASHGDSPALKLKENPEMTVADAYQKLNVEVYGGALLAPWFDRPLSVAGRAVVKTPDGVASRLVDLQRDVAMVPSLAIHMNREANTGYRYNPQRDLLPLYGLSGTADLKTMIAEKLDVEPDAILGSDLFLYNHQPPTRWGANDEFISSPRLDDAACAYASFAGLIQAEPATHIALHAVFDNEEVGSSTKQGAASTFLKDTLSRIVEAFGRSHADYLRALAQSFMISADNAHALHPNYPEKCDPVNQPVMGRGIVIKHSANQKYTSDALSVAVCKELCAKAGIRYQTFHNRSDMPGGSTLGNLSGNQVAVPTVDVGIAQLAMHSPYETCAARDMDDLVKLMQALYSASLTETAPGVYHLS